MKYLIKMLVGLMLMTAMQSCYSNKTLTGKQTVKKQQKERAFKGWDK
ncbi:hypothetical protein [Echinicola strongylocentroti]|nr:hypothetical protein [Echinicola strongylocentroti]